MRNATHYASHKEWHKGVAMKGMRIRSGNNHLSKDCSLSERDGNEGHWEGTVLDLRCTVMDSCESKGNSQGIKGPGLEVSFTICTEQKGWHEKGEIRIGSAGRGIILADPVLHSS